MVRKKAKVICGLADSLSDIVEYRLFALLMQKILPNAPAPHPDKAEEDQDREIHATGKRLFFVSPLD